MKEYKIALYAGDGIGIEVTAEAVKIIRAIEKLYGNIKVNMTDFNWGSRYWKETGNITPDNYLEILSEYDSVFLGAVGDPANIPDSIAVTPLIEMRQSFDQYIGLRPATLMPGVKSCLADKKFGDIDVFCVRENSEGEYINCGTRFKKGTADEVAIQTNIHTRKGVERIIRYGFKVAMSRDNHLTLATKSNALKFGMTFWDDVLMDVKDDYPSVTVDKCYIDALVMGMVQKPEFYDVIVASNMFGDIISDLAGAVTGSIGLAPSANVNPTKEFPSMFEPVHGSAPDIAGKQIANPIAAIRSAGMMLDHLGQPEAYKLIEKIVVDILFEGKVLTRDIGGNATTSQMGDYISEKILKSK